MTEPVAATSAQFTALEALARAAGKLELGAPPPWWALTPPKKELKS